MKKIHEGRTRRSIVPVNIRDLLYFLACCRAKNFTAAAREAHITQTAMTCAIKRLEQELGAPLFDRAGGRGGRRVSLTAQGVALREAAEAIILAVQAARDQVAEAGGLVTGTVTLGSTLHTGRLDLAGLFAEIRERHPGVVVQLRQSQAGSVGLVEAVRDGTHDIALTASTGAPPGIVLHTLLSEPMVYVCPPGHPLSRQPRVTVRDILLQNEKILRPPPGWGSRAAIDKALGPTQAADEVADYALQASLVRAGFATTLAPASAMSDGMLAGLRAVAVDDSRLRWTLSAAVSTERPMTAATKALLDAVKGAAECPHVPASSVP